MGKVTGLGWTTLTVENASAAAKDIRDDITNFQFSTPRGVQDTTGIDKYAMERLLLLADFSITLNGVFDSAADKAHSVLSTVADPTADAGRQVISVIDSQTMTATVLFTDYAISRAASGELTFSAPGVLSNGVAPAWS